MGTSDNGLLLHMNSSQGSKPSLAAQRGMQHVLAPAGMHIWA